ncbi:MAG: ribosomal L7Ae/L30e/S12e/Gadd45 family protein [Oscillospiraceae bacterium]|nr:ribosomal L7Ae/L30e/S12e/Gadd45 family protein [Oscillospiraceae bacterium]
MDEQKVRSYMGLSVRAGQAVFGEDACLKNVRNKQCVCLLLDGGASPNTVDRYESACTRAGVPLFTLPPGLLGAATGKPGMAMAMKPGGLANQLMGLLTPLEAEESAGESEKQENIGGAALHGQH